MLLHFRKLVNSIESDTGRREINLRRHLNQWLLKGGDADDDKQREKIIQQSESYAETQKKMKKAEENKAKIRLQQKLQQRSILKEHVKECKEAMEKDRKPNNLMGYCKEHIDKEVRLTWQQRGETLYPACRPFSKDDMRNQKISDDACREILKTQSSKAKKESSSAQDQQIYEMLTTEKRKLEEINKKLEEDKQKLKQQQKEGEEKIKQLEQDMKKAQKAISQCKNDNLNIKLKHAEDLRNRNSEPQKEIQKLLMENQDLTQKINENEQLLEKCNKLTKELKERLPQGELAKAHNQEIQKIQESKENKKDTSQDDTSQDQNWDYKYERDVLGLHRT